MGAGEEQIDANHPVYQQLQQYQEVPNVVCIEWYATCCHQGYYYWDGRGLLWEQGKKGLRVANVLQVLQCFKSTYLVVNLYELYKGGKPFSYKDDGQRIVHTSKLNMDLVLVPLLNTTEYQPCALVPSTGDELIVAHYV